MSASEEFVVHHLQQINSGAQWLLYRKSMAIVVFSLPFRYSTDAAPQNDIFVRLAAK
jgi:hypothetical protein